MPQNELTALYNIKKYRGTICKKKYRETIKKMYYIYIQLASKRKQQRSTDKDTTSRLEHFKTTYTDKKVKQYSFTLSTNIQTIQLTLSNIHTQDET